MSDSPEPDQLSVRATGVGRLARSTPRGVKSTDAAIPCAARRSWPHVPFHHPKRLDGREVDGIHVAPARGQGAAPCRGEGRRDECEEALSPDRPGSGGNSHRRDVVWANATSSHGRTSPHTETQQVQHGRRSVAAVTTDDGHLAGHCGGASIAVRKVSSRSMKTTVSNGSRPEHDSRITDAPMQHTVLQLRKARSARGEDMALRRQGLAQRRKAVGLTQEALAQRLGVERSTVVRWEAGDTEPLPSIRPHVAHALQVSLDQLAELLTEGENAGRARALPSDTEVTGPIMLPAMRPSRDECEHLVPPQVTEAFEALRGALRSAGVGPEDVDAPWLLGKSPQSGDVTTGTLVPTMSDAGGLARSEVAEPARAEVLQRSFLPAIPLDVEAADAQRRRATSRRFKRFAAAGILAVVFAGGAASLPSMTSRSDSIPPAGAGNPAAPLPAPHIGGSYSPGTEGSIGAIHPAPEGAPAVDPLPPAAAPAPQTIQASNPERTTSRPKSPAAAPPAPRAPAIPAEARAWSKAAEASANDYRKVYGRLGAPSHR